MILLSGRGRSRRQTSASDPGGRLTVVSFHPHVHEPGLHELHQGRLAAAEGVEDLRTILQSHQRESREETQQLHQRVYSGDT